MVVVVEVEVVEVVVEVEVVEVVVEERSLGGVVLGVCPGVTPEGWAGVGVGGWADKPVRW